MKKSLVLILGCSMAVSGCASLTLPQLPSVSSGPVQVGSIGTKDGYIVKNVTAYPKERVCNLEAYKVGFRNGFIDQWGTEILNSNLPNKYMIQEEPQSDWPYMDPSSPNYRCTASSVPLGSIDGRHEAEKQFNLLKSKPRRK